MKRWLERKPMIDRRNRSGLPVGIEVSGNGSDEVCVAGIELQWMIHVQPLHSHSIITWHIHRTPPDYHSHITPQLHPYYYPTYSMSSHFSPTAASSTYTCHPQNTSPHHHTSTTSHPIPHLCYPHIITYNAQHTHTHIIWLFDCPCPRHRNFITSSYAQWRLWKLEKYAGPVLTVMRPST